VVNAVEVGVRFIVDAAASAQAPIRENDSLMAAKNAPESGDTATSGGGITVAAAAAPAQPTTNTKYTTNSSSSPSVVLVVHLHEPTSKEN
jgi:hypothetical protein